jgi:hypothetical protein
LNKNIKISIIVTSGIIILTLAFYTYKFFRAKNETDSIPIIKDTTIFYRYKNELKHDTVIKWYEKIKYVNNKQQKINVQKIDSITSSDFANKDLIFKIDKEKDKVIIKAIDIKGDTLKEFYFDNVQRDFSVISQENNIFVKSKNIYFNGIDLDLSYNFRKEKEKRFSLSVNSGINWRERIFVNGRAGYNFGEKKIALECGIGIKIFK